MARRTPRVTSNEKRVTTLTVRSLTETAAFIQHLAASLRGGDVLALIGPLGAGKTTIVQLLARLLGVRQRPRSPSYTLLQPYPLPKPVCNIHTLVHVDAYRVTAEELLEAGLRDYLHDPHALLVIEWADRLGKALPASATTLTIGFGRGEQARTIRLKR